MSESSSSSVAIRIQEAMESLPPSEKRVARALLAHYPAAGLETTGALAERAGVSGPTVIRLAGRLGFGGYKELQAALREEIQAAREASPVSLAHRAGADPSSNLTAVAAASFIADLEATVRAIPESEMRRAADLIAADRRGEVVFLGGRFSGVLAEYLQLHVRQMRGRTRHVRAVDDAAAILVGMTRDDTLVVFDFRRYQEDVIEFSRVAAARGVRVVLITDTWMSPISEVATVVLPVAIDSPSPFDSYVAAMAVVETIVAAVHRSLGPRAIERMSAWDTAMARLVPPRRA